MTALWWLILIVACFTPTAIYYFVTKRCGGEPLILKERDKQ